MDAADSASAFAAIRAIQLGKWDDVLFLIHREIRARQATEKYKAEQLARTEFRAGPAPTCTCPAIHYPPPPACPVHGTPS